MHVSVLIDMRGVLCNGLIESWIKEESGSKSCNSTLLGSSVFSSFTKKGSIYWLKMELLTVAY
ncbi:hypothetical protein PGIN_3A1_00673 [Porphyromonas gingivalis]|nr:hypothetical protein PGIN_3A1_00673 [Porphyromonas gingivalis]